MAAVTVVYNFSCQLQSYATEQMKSSPKSYFVFKMAWSKNMMFLFFIL